MATKLKAIAPLKSEPRRPKIVIYGASGVGKTWASLDFPNVYYIDTEGGATGKHYQEKLKNSGGAYLGPEQGSLSLQSIIEQVQALTTEKHDFKTLVIDSITSVFNGEIANEAERMKREDKKNEFGADKKPAVGMMRQLINWLRRLDMNVILIGHEKAEWGLNAKGERVEVGKIPDAWEKLIYELDLSLQITKTGPTRNASVRKSRLEEFPDGSRFPWSYMEFGKKYGQDIINKKHQEIALATQEQLVEVNGLIAMAKIPQETVEGWFKKYNVNGFGEMDADAVARCIKHLNESINPKEKTNE